MNSSIFFSCLLLFATIGTTPSWAAGKPQLVTSFLSNPESLNTESEKSLIPNHLISVFRDDGTVSIGVYNRTTRRGTGRALTEYGKHDFTLTHPGPLYTVSYTYWKYTAWCFDLKFQAVQGNSQIEEQITTLSFVTDPRLEPGSLKIGTQVPHFKSFNARTVGFERNYYVNVIAGFTNETYLAMSHYGQTSGGTTPAPYYHGLKESDLVRLAR